MFSINCYTLLTTILVSLTGLTLYVSHLGGTFRHHSYFLTVTFLTKFCVTFTRNLEQNGKINTVKKLVISSAENRLIKLRDVNLTISYSSPTWFHVLRCCDHAVVALVFWDTGSCLINSARWRLKWFSNRYCNLS